MEDNIKKLLSDKEEILWQGKPNKNLFTSADWFMIPSSAFTLVIILGLWFYFIPNFIGTDLPAMFNLFYALIIFVLLYQLFLRLFVKSYVYKRTEYYVTNHRILEVRNLNKVKIEEVKINQMSSYHKVIKPNSRSKVVFGELPPFSFLFENTYAYPRFTYSSYNKPPLGFYDLDAEVAEEVYSIVSKIKNSL